MKNYTIMTYLRKSLCVAAFGLVIVLAGCKKDDGPETPQYSNVLFVNAIPDAASLDFYIDKQRKNVGIGFGSFTPYTQILAGSHEITVTESNSLTQKINFSQNFERDRSYSIFGIGTNSAPDRIVLTDTIATPTADQAWVRFVNLSPDNTSYYIGLNGGNQQFPTRPFKQSSNYKSFPAGSHDFQIVNAGTAAVVKDPEPVQFQGGKVYTLVLYGTGSGTTPTLDLKLIGN